jgi:prolyl oligopeptidase
VSELEHFRSHDGVGVPARILYLKSTVINGKNPTYIETYGAFNYIGFYLFPELDTMKLEFLKRGGIVVGTGVRGGAERGYQWYRNGTGQYKANPAHDLIAIAQGLVKRGYTTSEKIVSTGTSAGGDNVALAAQFSPESFGLVIPVSGIHDHLGYLHLDRWGPQWLMDYLNPYDSTDFSAIYARSPLEVRKPAERYPQYLIVCGEEDSRVSKVHSYKLKAVIDEFNEGGTYLHCVDHAGHWPNASFTHGRRGVQTNAVIWSWVYDYLGLKF